MMRARLIASAVVAAIAAPLEAQSPHKRHGETWRSWAIIDSARD